MCDHCQSIHSSFPTAAPVSLQPPCAWVTSSRESQAGCRGNKNQDAQCWHSSTKRRIISNFHVFGIPNVSTNEELVTDLDPETHLTESGIPQSLVSVLEIQPNVPSPSPNQPESIIPTIQTIPTNLTSFLQGLYSEHLAAGDFFLGKLAPGFVGH